MARGVNVSRWYRFLYGLGITPWESDTAVLGEQMARLLSNVEADGQSLPARALDLGCGTGRWSVMLAQRGWRTTGIDVVPKAVRRARVRAREAGVDVSFIEGDITRLDESNVGTDFSLFLDVECFNHLSDTAREAVGRGVNAVASSDATLLLLVWKRARRGPLPPGATQENVEAAFAGWKVVHEEPYDGEMPGPLAAVAPRWYRLERSVNE